jgi:hypothetical protein
MIMIQNQNGVNLDAAKFAAIAQANPSSSAIDRVLARKRKRRSVEYDSDSEQERILGLASVILGRLKSDVELETFEAFRLFSGLSESGELLIHYHKPSVSDSYSFYLSDDVKLTYQTCKMGLEGPVIERLDLDSPEDFLMIDSKSVEELYEDLMKEGFWDRVAFKHSHRGKPGYENVWSEKL